MKKNQIVILTSAILILGFVVSNYLYKSQKSKEIAFIASEKASTFIRKHSPTLGSDDAKVYLVEFLDPACGTCSAFYPYVKKLMADSPGKIKLVIRYAPFHKGSDYVVKIIEAAKEQGKYWETLELLLKYQAQWVHNHVADPDQALQVLNNSGLVDINKITNDMNNPEIENRIKQDIEDANTLNVRQTPEFFVNGKPLPSFGAEELKALLDSEIEKAYSGGE